MNSYNQYAYGAIGDWIYQNIAGIQTAEPGYKKILSRPVFGGKLTWAEASYDCPYVNLRYQQCYPGLYAFLLI